MARLTEDELKAITDSEIRQSIGGMSGGRLSEQRRRAEYYYLGLAKGDLSPPEIDGRSNFVDTTVRNQIEWMIPSLMKTFCSGDEVVQFTPTKPNDNENAKNATEYINYLFFKKNDGYTVLQTAIRDALLQKAGIIKIWWDDSVEESREEYRALSDIDLAMLMDDDEITPIEQKSYPDEEDQEQRQQAEQQLTQQLQQVSQSLANEPQIMPQMGQQPPPSPAMQQAQQLQAQLAQLQQTPPKMLYDVSFKRSKKSGKICIDNIPPEEFIISRKCKKMTDGYMKGHRVLRTISDLKAMGYKNVDDITSDDSGISFAAERMERLQFDDESPYLNQDNDTLDPSMRTVWITEMYMKVDFDGDGIAEWRKIVRAGNQILENVECDGAPFASLIPIILPHRFFGLSVADLGMEPQKLQTQLVRSILDNQFLQVNGRYFAVENQVNLDDLLTSRPGGVVRVKSAGAVGRLDQGAGATGESMQMLEWMQDFTENSTGWTRRSQGTGPTGLQAQTATGMNLITNRDDMRLDLIARNFAEGGITELFRLILKLVCQYQNKEEEISVSGSWLKMDPREWKNQFTLNVNVGLGTNNKEQQAQHIMGMLNIQKEGLQIGISTPENIYNSAVLYAEALGQKSGDKFFTNPAQQQPQAPQPDPEMMKAQAAQQLQQGQLQADVQKHQAQMVQRENELKLEAQRDQLKAQHQAEIDQQKAQLDMQERQHEGELRAQLEQQKLASMDADREFEMWKAKLDAEVKLTIAQISASKATDGETTQVADSSALALQAILEKLSQPKQVIRDANGRLAGLV